MDQLKKTRIIIDSTTDLSEEYRDLAVIVPLIVSFGDREYLDGVELSRDEFYEKLETTDLLPKTSQASPATFEQIYKEIREDHMNGIVITVSSTLSGTYQSACLAATEYPEIAVIDSRTVAVGAGILAEYAIDQANAGVPFEDLTRDLQKKKDEICLIAMLDTLEYLKKGGRISKTVAFAGGVLNIKPVVTVVDGEILILGKARGAKKANNLLIEQIREFGVKYDMPILLGYSGTSPQLLQNYIEDSAEVWKGHVEKLDCSQICTVVGTHVGPGAVAVAFFKEKV